VRPKNRREWNQPAAQHLANRDEPSTAQLSPATEFLSRKAFATPRAGGPDAIALAQRRVLRSFVGLAVRISSQSLGVAAIS